MANYTILLIDYEPRSIERFRDPLVGRRATPSRSRPTASRASRRFIVSNPDMVLVEAMIPKKHGFEVCQELKRTPHGRKTPVIITTGVYKGRKYRTQALHIYGCDEYIEKPIAPEQLLELVGKFLKPGSSGTPPKSTERGPGESEPGGPPRPHNTSSSDAKTVTHEPDARTSCASRTATRMTRSARTWTPSSGAPAPRRPDAFAGAGTKLAAAADPIAAIPPELDAAPDDDPFAEIRAELNAVLGPPPDPPRLRPDAPLESVPDFIPSDQLPPPSILEALPIPEAEPPSPEADLPASKRSYRLPKRSYRRPTSSCRSRAPRIPPDPPCGASGTGCRLRHEALPQEQEIEAGKARSDPGADVARRARRFRWQLLREVPAPRALESARFRRRADAFREGPWSNPSWKHPSPIAGFRFGFGRSPESSPSSGSTSSSSATRPTVPWPAQPARLRRMRWRAVRARLRAASNPAPRLSRRRPPSRRPPEPQTSDPLAGARRAPGARRSDRNRLRPPKKQADRPTKTQETLQERLRRWPPRARRASNPSPRAARSEDRAVAAAAAPAPAAPVLPRRPGRPPDLATPSPESRRSRSPPPLRPRLRDRRADPDRRGRHDAVVAPRRAPVYSEQARQITSVRHRHHERADQRAGDRSIRPCSSSACPEPI